MPITVRKQHANPNGFAPPAGPKMKAGSVLSRAMRVGDMKDSWIKMLLYGANGCLAGDTHIRYKIRSRDGKSQNEKGGTLEHLYERFHGIVRRGKGYYQRPSTVGSSFYVSCVTDDGRLTHNLITDVLDSGDRPVFEVTTESGKVIRATADHEFMVADGYKPLALLKPEHEVMVSAGRRFKAEERKKPVKRPWYCVKYHPRERLNIVGTSSGPYEYHRISRTHLVFEAARNNMTPEEYREALNTWSPNELRKLWTVPEGAEVHHIDENPLNDIDSNLLLAESSAEHQKLFHADCVTRPGMAVYVVPDRITSIKRMGTVRTFDVAVADPFHNFIASGFAVHNCGKTSLAAQFPGPLLLLSYERCPSGGARSIRKRNPDVTWLRVGTPEGMNPDDPNLVLNADDVIGDTDRIAEELKEHCPFKTVVFDHVTVFQDWVLEKLLGRPLPQQLNFGAVSGDNYRDRAEITKTKLKPFADLPCHTVFIGKEKDHNPPREDKVNPNTGKVSPDMRPKFLRGMQQESFVSVDVGGATAGWLQDLCEYACRLYMAKEIEVSVTEQTILGKKQTFRTETETGKFVRSLRVAYHPNYFSRFRSDDPDALPEAIDNPTWAKLKAVIDGQPLPK